MHTAHFQHIHCDIVGSLPESHGNSYCLTIIDSVIHWPAQEAT